jgi:hypothetical protein
MAVMGVCNMHGAARTFGAGGLLARCRRAWRAAAAASSAARFAWYASSASLTACRGGVRGGSISSHL